MSKVCIYGAGAIGGLLGVRLALAGEDVSLIARGAHLAAMQRDGLKLLAEGQEWVAHPRATDNPAELEPQDFVIVTLKAPAFPQEAQRIQPLLGPQTAVVTAVNGLPYWYFYNLEGPWKDHQLDCVDPHGDLWRLVEPWRALGCVVYPAAEVVAPGVVWHVSLNRFSIGEPSGEKTERITQLGEMLQQAGFKAPIRSQIRNEIWVKLWGNLAFNPISALTHATLDVIATEPGLRAVVCAMMTEAQEIAEKLGVRFGIDLDQRIDGAKEVGVHKTSMLQDLERGRPMEIDALVTVVAELGRLVEVPSPTIDTVLALVQERGRQAGCY